MCVGFDVEVMVGGGASCMLGLDASVLHGTSSTSVDLSAEQDKLVARRGTNAHRQPGRLHPCAARGHVSPACRAPCGLPRCAALQEEHNGGRARRRQLVLLACVQLQPFELELGYGRVEHGQVSACLAAHGHGRHAAAVAQQARAGCERAACPGTPLRTHVRAYAYDSMRHSVSLSLNLGVSPARTTLSEQAMHSTMSPAARHEQRQAPAPV